MPFSYLTCLHTTTLRMLSLFSLVKKISLKIWERPLACEMFTSSCRPWIKKRCILKESYSNIVHCARDSACRARGICISLTFLPLSSWQQLCSRGIEVKGKTRLELFFTLLNINTVDATLKLGHTSQRWKTTNTNWQIDKKDVKLFLWWWQS